MLRIRTYNVLDEIRVCLELTVDGEATLSEYEWANYDVQQSRGTLEALLETARDLVLDHAEECLQALYDGKPPPDVAWGDGWREPRRG